MTTEDEGSVTRWLDALKAGDPAAAQRLWERYFTDLIRLARARLRAAPRAAEDEEDVALSAFDSFFAAAARGRFPRLEDRHDLWRILITVTERKAFDLLRRQAHRVPDGVGADLLDRVAGAEPTPEFAAMVAEEYRRRLDSLPDETLRRVAVLKMEGYTNEEVAARLGCGLRSVVRKLGLIRRTWLAEGPP